jgi:Bacterial transcriptional regulator
MPFAAVSERRLKAIRERGFETSYAENHVDVNGVAAAIVTDEGVAIGSMTIAGPSARLPEDLLLAKAGILCRACENLSPQLSQLLGPNASSVLDALDVEPVRTTSARRRLTVDTDLWALAHG